MCGITGIFNLNQSLVDSKILDKMTDSLAHRGPDGRGIYLNKHIGLGHRRLSIIDVESGAQPMFDQSQRYAIVFNGEIFNYIELQTKLRECGITFKTHSDTEVLLQAFITWGECFLEKVNGMFAFAIYDSHKDELFIARDRLGIKPFYYYFQNGLFLFASEPKAILCHPDVKKEVNLNSIGQYMSLRYTLHDATFFENILSMPAGHLLQVSKSKFQLTRYWELKHQELKVSYPEALEMLNDKLNIAVKRTLISDVPIGSFLSAGIDSSSILPYVTNKKLSTITMGFEGAPDLNEIEPAREIAKYFKTDHHEVILNAPDLISILPKLIYHRDGPLEVQNEIALFQMSKHLKKFFTVVLSGEGADEAFVGYPKYANTAKRWKQYQILKKLNLTSFRSLFHKLKNLNLNGANEFSSFVSMVMLGIDFRLDLFNQDVLINMKKPDVYKWNNGFFEKNKNLSTIQQLLKFDHENHLGSLLARVDKMTMAASVEGRVPYLDHELFEFAWNLPMNYKFDKKENKRILKDNLRSKIPINLLQKNKLGFAIPHSLWLKDKKYQNFVSDVLFDNQTVKRNYFDIKIVKNIFENAMKENQDPLNQEYVWRMLNLELWHRGVNL